MFYSCSVTLAHPEAPHMQTLFNAQKEYAETSTIKNSIKDTGLPEQTAEVHSSKSSEVAI